MTDNFRIKQIVLEVWREKYAPDQPRIPAGDPEGGQWSSEGGGWSKVGSATARTRSGKIKTADIYKVDQFDSVPVGVVVVGKRGEIFYARDMDVTHGQMVRSVDPNATVDDYIRFTFEKGMINASTTAAGIEVDISTDWETPAINNIYKALGRLNRVGIPASFKVKIRTVDRPIITTVKSLRNTNISELLEQQT